MFYKNSSKEDQRIKKPYIPLFLLVTIIVGGTIGYDIIWTETDSNIIDALYMTIITITTVGYAEVFPLDTTGRIFTMIIGVLGIGSLFYLLSIFMENLFTYQLLNIRGKKKVQKRLDKLSNHIIVVGYGRVGELATKELIDRDIEFVIIDKEIPDELKSLSNVISIEGDATDDAILSIANIEEAKSLVVATADASTNLFIVLSARELNEKLFIISRSDNTLLEKKLLRAGADRTLNPYSAGGQKMANIAIDPQIMDFIDSNLGTKDGDFLKIEQFELSENNDWHGKTLKELDIRQKSGVTIIGVIRDNDTNLNPFGEFELKSKDQLVAIGTKEQLMKFNSLCNH
ncbi:MAG: potassium channel protein [Candidatus Kapaibacterium sp.]